MGVGSLPENTNLEDERIEDGEEISRIVIDFAGPGMADVERVAMKRITVGQLQVAALEMKFLADRQRKLVDLRRQQDAQRTANKIIVPSGGILQ